jgi:hypothetical protein
MRLRRLMQIARLTRAYQERRCASQQIWSPDDRYGSFASIHGSVVEVRFTPDSDRIADIPELPKSADFGRP